MYDHLVFFLFIQEVVFVSVVFQAGHVIFINCTKAAQKSSAFAAINISLVFVDWNMLWLIF